MKKILSIGLFGFIAAAAGVAVAAPQDGTHTGRGGGRFQQMSDFLGLSEDQQTAWKSLQEQQKPQMVQLRQEGRDLHLKLKAATDAATPDPAAVGQATLAMKAHMQKVMAARQAFESQLEGLLNPDQKTKYDAFKAAHKQGGRRPGFKGHGPAGQGSPDGQGAPEGTTPSTPPVKG
jgi:Spy/CpxP family protein refolding chaperone